MKGLGSSVTPIIAGVRSDVEKLLSEYVKTSSVRFDDFAKCFKKMKFSLIFLGRPASAELREFLEKTLLTALGFCFNPYAFQTKVGGLYLLFAVYFLQHCKYKMRIRITLEQWKELLDFIDLLLQQNHYDAAFCFFRLRNDCAFKFCAMQDESNPLNFHQFEQQYRADEGGLGLRGEKCVMTELVSDPVHRQLHDIHDSYIAVKNQLDDSVSDSPPTSLQMVNVNPAMFVENLTKEYGNRTRSIRKRQATSTGHEKRQAKSHRAQLKQKAYVSAPDQARHRRHRQQHASVDNDSVASVVDAMLDSPERINFRQISFSSGDPFGSPKSLDVFGPGSKKRGRPPGIRRKNKGNVVSASNEDLVGAKISTRGRPRKIIPPRRKVIKAQIVSNVAASCSTSEDAIFNVQCAELDEQVNSIDATLKKFLDNDAVERPNRRKRQLD